MSRRAYPLSAKARTLQRCWATFRLPKGFVCRRARFLQGIAALVCGGFWLIAALLAHPVELNPADAGGAVLIALGILLIYAALSMKPPEPGAAREPEGEPEKNAPP